MRIKVFLFRHEGIEPKLPTIVEADVPEGTDSNGLRDCIKAAVTEWANAGSEDAQQAFAYAGEDFNIGDLSNCLYNDEHIGDEDCDALVEALARHGVNDLVISSPDEGDWTYDTPLVEALDLEE